MQLSVGGLRFASTLARLLPPVVTDGAARVLSRVYARRAPTERLTVERNLRRVYAMPIDLPAGTTGSSGAVERPEDHVLPADAPITEAELQRKVQRVFDHYAAYWVDSLRLPHVSVDEVDRRFTYEGLEHLMVPLRDGRGVVAGLPHLGGWEWAARWLVDVQDLQVAAAVEKLEPPELYQWFLEYRRDTLGMQVVPVGPTAAVELAAALAGGSVLALLCDRDLTGDGIEVEFFGERTRLPGGPALLALRSGFPLVPVGVFFEGDHHHAVVLPALDTERRGRLRADVERVTQDLAHALERLICRDPEQWHVLQPNWPSDFDAIGAPRPAWAALDRVDPRPTA